VSDWPAPRALGNPQGRRVTRTCSAVYCFRTPDARWQILKPAHCAAAHLWQGDPDRRVAGVIDSLVTPGTVRKGVGVLVKGLWRFPRLELGAEVIVERRQRVVRQKPWC
jgi:hypothetical protein